jgi:hypothetical protein
VIAVVAVRVGFDKPHEHPNDALQPFLSGANVGDRRLSFGNEHIECCGTLQPEPLAVSKKRQRSFVENLPFPSAIFNTTDVDARSS